MLKMAFIGFISSVVLAFGAQAKDVNKEAISLMTNDGIPLSGILTLPTGQAKGAVVILPGSGNVGMDGDESSPYKGAGYKNLPAKLSEQYAESLAAIGVASIRYSKRGFEDTTQFPHQTIPYLLEDARAAVEMLRARFPGLKVGIVGSSEGANLAILLAAESKVDVVFALGLMTRSIEETFGYQFLEWPVELLAKKADLNGDGELSAEELKRALPDDQLPLFGAGALPPLLWKNIDADQSGSISIANELIPTYAGLYQTVLQVAASDPSLAYWFASIQAMPAFSSLAAKISAPVYVYHGMEDAQIPWKWTVADYKKIKSATKLRLLPTLGHCMSPMEGVIGQTKTTGPAQPSLINALEQDAREAFGL